MTLSAFLHYFTETAPRLPEALRREVKAAARARYAARLSCDRADNVLDFSDLAARCEAHIQPR